MTARRIQWNSNDPNFEIKKISTFEPGFEIAVKTNRGSKKKIVHDSNRDFNPYLCTPEKFKNDLTN